MHIGVLVNVRSASLLSKVLKHVGGYYVGSFYMNFSSTKDARNQAASIKAGFEGWGAKASASADFSKSVDKLQGFESKSCEYCPAGHLC
jgi:hypothetical protein